MDLKLDLKKMSISGIRAMIKDLKDEEYAKVIPMLREDTRKGVSSLATSLENKGLILEKEKQRIRDMKLLENECVNQGFSFIGGIDEVGRGPLAGPVVTCVVIMRKESEILYVNDSKKLSRSKREALCSLLLNEAVDYEIGIADNETIDKINILNATKKAMIESLDNIKTKPEFLLIDAVSLEIPIKQKAIIHGDSICYSIAAASIIAKVYRDHLMESYHELYPEYGFNHNMGYGTAQHIEAIKKYGPTPIHRRSFLNNFGVV
ncbi:MAG: ribonuclease HII [Eubacteriaceae bacterium]